MKKIENDGRIQFHIRLTKESADWIDKEAQKKATSQNMILSYLLNELIDNKRKT
ncbi:hypothetical protein AGMMS49975_14560 [Clostridia bacterium]|nr:hypothetical protein AGMMS49975_14560 [Clostridia bacterium]GHU76023.1 hypothetical protein FACS1894188_07900 [Clostridia bacterium]